MTVAVWIGSTMTTKTTKNKTDLFFDIFSWQTKCNKMQINNENNRGKTMFDELHSISLT